MDPEQRPNNRTTTTSGGAASELFICFTSRHTPSSKSILTPGRTCDPPQNSLSSSLSRRLCSSGSVKGSQASPMFPPKGKKKGGASDNPEPSSPKVTCIGQVRVKTKKQGKKLRSRSKRRGEVSFRRVEHGSAAAPEGLGQISRSFSRSHFNQQRNQRWVHLPVTICEALRSFGAELNCLLPCRSSCMSATREREKSAGSGRIEESGGSGTSTSCGTVFARWLVALQDGDGKGREIELMVAEHEPEDPPESCRSRRRHVFDDINIEAEGFEGEGEKKSNVCVPPKNALLLMRCRSDPVKMAALSNQFFDKDEEDSGHKESHEEMPRTVHLETEHSKNVEEDEHRGTELKAKDWVTQETHQEQYPEPKSETELNLSAHELNLENQETELVTSELALAAEATDMINSSPPQFVVETQNQEIEDTTESESKPEAEDYSEEQSETEAEVLAEMAVAVVTKELGEGETETTTRERSEPEEPGQKSTEERGESQPLPDCLMLMMYEPKLSMEVSKETWVCTTDFIRWLPERAPVKGVIKTDEPRKSISTDSSTAQPQRNKQPQPPRSSCSFPEPAPASCEPLVLTRCKSEPKRAATKLDGTRTMRSAFNEVLRCV